MKYAYFVSEIGERLLKLRREREGLDAAQVARAIGITPSALSQWERGTVKNLRPENLLAAARYFQVSLPWLITGAGPRRTEEASTESEAEALRLFRKLSGAGQLAALAQLEWMTSREGGGSQPGDAAMPNPLRRFQ
jgi:transcriptional regulator with XRE-family HTH domain